MCRLVASVCAWLPRHVLEKMVRLSGFLFVCSAGAVMAVTLTVSTTGGNASSPLLYGIMFEVGSLTVPSMMAPDAGLCLTVTSRILTTQVRFLGALSSKLGL
jgi:hypothetical protein